ncbi:hypothetical protein J2W42_002902 [Rhizobium tibeticum]|nr:hypothetical protein [Rhizobium tibeticum]MDP9810041.1 hypothetical protein [Rhizobium tibeticum]
MFVALTEQQCTDSRHRINEQGNQRSRLLLIDQHLTIALAV